MAEEAVAQAMRSETFESFFHSNYERLLRAMYLATADRAEAEDLAQDAMARVCERWERVAATEDPVGYLFRTALNLRRSRLRRVAVAARKVVRAGPASDPMHAVEERDAVRRALAALPRGQREALVLVEWLDMTDVEAGAALRISPGAVRTRASRARAALRDLLKEERHV